MCYQGTRRTQSPNELDHVDGSAGPSGLGLHHGCIVLTRGGGALASLRHLPRDIDLTYRLDEMVVDHPSVFL